MPITKKESFNKEYTTGLPIFDKSLIFILSIFVIKFVSFFFLILKKCSYNNNIAITQNAFVYKGNVNFKKGFMCDSPK